MTTFKFQVENTAAAIHETVRFIGEDGNPRGAPLRDGWQDESPERKMAFRKIARKAIKAYERAKLGTDP